MSTHWRVLSCDATRTFILNRLIVAIAFRAAAGSSVQAGAAPLTVDE
jgi:hypothetical protein